MKHILITSFHTIVSRNILATPILGALIHKADVQVVVLCYRKKEQFFKDEFGCFGVVIHPLSLSLARRDIFLRYLSLAALKTASLSIKRRTEMKGSGLLLSALLPSFLGMAILRILNPMLTPREPFSHLFALYNPTVVFATDMTNEYDTRLVEEAKRRGIPSIGMVRSWDNLTSKGMMRAVPTELLVNNHIVRMEAAELHGVPSDTITVVGIPHYDRYLLPPSISREALAEKIGIPAHKRFILFAPAGDRYLARNEVDRDVALLLEKIVPPDWDILVRLPPADSVTSIEDNPFSSPRIHIYRPSGRFKTVKNTEMSRQDDDVLIASLRASELVVAGPSTMVIDAAFFDKPVVLFDFDGLEHRPYLESVRRYYDYDHFAPVIESGGAPLARSAEELQNIIRAYIANPSRDAASRRKIVESECAFTDGRSSERVVKVLSAYLDGS